MFGGWCFVPGKPVVRGYDFSLLFREDCLLRIQRLQMEVDADLKNIKQAEKEYAAAEEQLCQCKKEFGWFAPFFLSRLVRPPLMPDGEKPGVTQKISTKNLTSSIYTLSSLITSPVRLKAPNCLCPHSGSSPKWISHCFPCFLLDSTTFFLQGFPDGTIDLALIKYDSEESVEAKAAGLGPCIHHFAIEVDNLERSVAEIRKFGCEIISDPGGVPVKFRALGGTVAELVPKGRYKKLKP